MELIRAIILGIIQGVGEFLPISSSGHLALAARVLQADNTHDLMLHGATAFSIVVVFRGKIHSILRTAFTYPLRSHELLYLLLSAIPIGVVGLFFESTLRTYTQDISSVGIGWLITGVLLLLPSLLVRRGGALSTRVALLMGLWQVLALWPGVSRSGTMIAMALCMGVDKPKAVEFSFLMALLPILGACSWALVQFFSCQPRTVEDIFPLTPWVGAFTAFTVGIISCACMRRVVQRGKLWYFALYCLALGLLTIAWGG